jgi:hypothetical protein
LGKEGTDLRQASAASISIEKIYDNYKLEIFNQTETHYYYYYFFPFCMQMMRITYSFALI